MYTTHIGTQNCSRATLIAALVALASVAQLSGCTSVPVSMADDAAKWEKRTAERAAQRWADAIAGRTSAAFALYSKASRIDYPEAMIKRHVDSLRAANAKVVDVKCAATSCTVNLEVMVTVAMQRVSGRQVAVPAQERWVLEEGDVFFVRQ